MVQWQNLFVVVVNVEVCQLVVKVLQVTTGPIAQAKVARPHGHTANGITCAEHRVEVRLQHLFLVLRGHRRKHHRRRLREAPTKADKLLVHAAVRADEDRRFLRHAGNSLMELHVRCFLEFDAVLLREYHFDLLVLLRGHGARAEERVRGRVVRDDAIAVLRLREEPSESPRSLGCAGRLEARPRSVVVHHQRPRLQHKSLVLRRAGGRLHQEGQPVPPRNASLFTSGRLALGPRRHGPPDRGGPVVADRRGGVHSPRRLGAGRVPRLGGGHEGDRGGRQEEAHDDKAHAGAGADGHRQGQAEEAGNFHSTEEAHELDPGKNEFGSAC
mmetsp:Transcript_105731/g.309255  ORF Transcript_105731/g.309255 Transcript_105731/m.309255 type:complete len:328 (-) Transcript_105731:543-1526(-)